MPFSCALTWSKGVGGSEKPFIKKPSQKRLVYKGPLLKQGGEQRQRAPLALQDGKPIEPIDFIGICVILHSPSGGTAGKMNT